MTASRGTSNGNANGSSYDRARRRRWLIEHYRADTDILCSQLVDGVYEEFLVPACRCYRCGTMLIDMTAFDAEYPEAYRPAATHLTVDRIIPGCDGGTYRRSNIRPACCGCNSETGGRVRSKTTRKKAA